MSALREELVSLEAQSIIRKVKEHTACVHHGNSAEERWRNQGLCRLEKAEHIIEHNEQIIRPRFDAATPFQVVRTIPKGMRFFTIADALKG